MTTTPTSTTPINPRLGAFVWWDLEKCQVTPDHLRQVLRAEGLTDTGQDTDIKVPDIEAISAIKRAARLWSSGRGNADRYKAEVVRVEAGRAYVGILRHVREGDKEVGWRQVELIAYDLQAGCWTNQFPSDQARLFQTQADDLIKYLDHLFLRPEVLQPMLGRMSAISLRRQGGIYFVPLSALDKAQQMRRVVAQFGAAQVHIVQVESDEDARQSVSSSVQDHVLGQLVDVQEKLTEWRESTRAIRKDSQAVLLGELADLLAMADLYERTLEVSLKDLRAQVVGCQDEAMAILAGSAPTMAWKAQEEAKAAKATQAQAGA